MCSAALKKMDRENYKKLFLKKGYRCPQSCIGKSIENSINYPIINNYLQSELKKCKKNHINLLYPNS